MKMLVIAAAVIATASPTLAANLVVNGSFETVTATDKSYFSAAGVAGWSGGANLDFLDFPGTADDPNKYLAVYPGFPTVSPVGGNFFEADGDRNYGTPIFQTIDGLVAGATYAVTFYQAAGQQLNFTGPTTEAWDVSLGAETHRSSVFSLPEGGTGPWQKQTLSFTATDASEVLQFFAYGTPDGKPPISFLDGVSLTASVPEPATWAMMLGGFGFIGFALRRRAVATVAA